MNRVITINFTIMQYAFFSLRLEAGKNIFSEFSCALKIKLITQAQLKNASRRLSSLVLINFDFEDLEMLEIVNSWEIWV